VISYFHSKKAARLNIFYLTSGSFLLLALFGLATPKDFSNPSFSLESKISQPNNVRSSKLSERKPHFKIQGTLSLGSVLTMETSFMAIYGIL
jgi:hypothetical protein